MVKIYPSLMAADQLNLQDAIDSIAQQAYGVHIDIMDGQFVPNVTYGPQTVNAIAAYTTLIPLVHLMVNDHAFWLDRLVLMPKSIVCYHYETTKNHEQTIAAIREQGWLAGLAISPSTLIADIVPLLPLVDQVLVMSVEPGFAGQSFIPGVTQKIDELSQVIQDHKLSATISVDGGITHENIRLLALKGVEGFCVGSSVFSALDPGAEIDRLAQAASGE